jgi:hypothetical protein
MAEGRHISKAELDEMERRKRNAAERDEDSGAEPNAGDREQQSDLDKTQTRKRILDPSITMGPD